MAGLGEFVVSHAAHSADLGDDAERGAVWALWSALFSDLVTSALVVALGGAVVAALASTELPTGRLAGGSDWARRAARSSGRPARLVRATLLIAAGSVLIFDPVLLGKIALVTAGVLVVLAGVSQLPAAAPRAEAARAPSAAASPLLLAGAMALAMAATALVLVLVLPAPGSATVESAGSAAGCNGSEALCVRRLDRVVFPGTHNSYAAADEPGWLFANQRHGIERQLRDGIRALTLDIHFGVSDPSTGRVRTDLAGEDSSRNKVAQQLSPGALRVADSLVGRVGTSGVNGERRAYLCHTLCELGAEPLDDQLRIIGSFLATHPGAVVITFIEPYVPVGTIERALTRVDLLSHAARLRLGEPLPTLGELKRADTRLVVLAEEDGGSRPWYLPGFSFVQDTPLGAKTPAQLRCTRYRGRPDSPMLLVNHWIPPFPPSVTRNEQIGGRFLERRLRQCERRRRMLPNLIAVDFYERSGVVEAARRLNPAQG